MRVIISCKGIEAETILPRLIEKGFKVDTVLEAIGVITGEIETEKFPSLEKVEGITVEEDKIVQLAPPDSPIQ